VDNKVRIILLWNVCGQHDPYYIIVERMWTKRSVLYYCRTNVDNMVRIILLQIVCGQHGPYYIILEHMWTTRSVLYYYVERMWTTRSVLYYFRTYVDNMVRILFL
jgi:hypothetical protein